MPSIFKNRQLIINFLLGLGLISIPFLSSPDLGTGLQMLKVSAFQKSLLSYFLLLLFFYLNYYFFIPKFYVSKKWIFLCLGLAISYLAILKWPEILIPDSGKMPPMLANPYNIPPPFKPNDKNIFFSFFSRDRYFFQFLGIFILSLFLRLDERLNKIKNEKLSTEVSYLKAQINPHFLFNTLNSLYALALTKSDKAPNAILKLSDLMRHVVTESNKDFIPLEKEVNYIKNFIDLQQLRLTENTQLVSRFSGDFKNKKIAPLLLISIVENAFKFGANADDASKIDIRLNVDDNNLLTLYVENSIVNTAVISSEKGLKNTKKQLDILYPNSYKLTINEENNTHKVHLAIPLE